MQHIHQEPTMVDPALQNELKLDEQLLWWGRPDPMRKAKSASTQTASYIVFGVLAVVAIFLLYNNINLIFEEISFFGRPDSDSIFLLFVSLGLLFIPLYRFYIFYSIAQKRTNDLRQTIYGITNRRVIAMTANKQGLSVNSYTQNDIGQINRVETGGGWGDVAYGKVRQVQRGRNTISVTEKLQGIPNAHMVEDILSRTFGNYTQPPQQAPMQAQQYQYPPLLLHYEQPPQATPWQEAPPQD
ncbi:MAG: hypothetical protein ACRDHZ_03530 [Ktedonobacteraceae bacterium]